MLFSLLALRLNGTHQNFYNQLRNNQDVPMIALFWAQWCGHCKRFYPIFQKVAKKYENNTDIVFMDINCTKEDGLCQKNDINVYPTVLLGLYNQTQRADVRRTEDGFEECVKRILKIKSRKYEKVVDEKKKIYELPVFKFIINNQDEETKKMVDVAIASMAEYNFNQFQVTYSSKAFVGKPKISAQVDEDFTVEMNAPISLYNIVDFLTQNSLPIFSPWSFSRIRKFDRRFVMLIPKDQKDFQTYRYLAHKYYKDFLWGDDSGAKRNDVYKKYFNITKKDVPALVIIDSKATYYTALKNLDDPHKLKEYEGYFERDVFQKNYFTMNIEHDNYISGFKYLGKLFLKVFVAVLAIVLAIVWIAIKIENRKVKNE